MPRCQSPRTRWVLTFCSHRLVGRWWEIWVWCGLAGLPGWLLQTHFREDWLGYSSKNLPEDGGQPCQHPHPTRAGVHPAQPEKRWFVHVLYGPFPLICIAVKSQKWNKTLTDLIHPSLYLCLLTVSDTSNLCFSLKLASSVSSFQSCVPVPQKFPLVFQLQK